MIVKLIIMAPKPRPKLLVLKGPCHDSLLNCITKKQIQREYTIYFHQGSTNDSCLRSFHLYYISSVDPKLSGFNSISILTMDRKMGRLAKSVFELAQYFNNFVLVFTVVWVEIWLQLLVKYQQVPWIFAVLASAKHFQYSSRLDLLGFEYFDFWLRCDRCVLLCLCKNFRSLHCLWSLLQASLFSPEVFQLIRPSSHIRYPLTVSKKDFPLSSEPWNLFFKPWPQSITKSNEHKHKYQDTKTPNEPSIKTMTSNFWGILDFFHEQTNRSQDEFSVMLVTCGRWQSSYFSYFISRPKTLFYFGF